MLAICSATRPKQTASRSFSVHVQSFRLTRTDARPFLPTLRPYLHQPYTATAPHSRHQSAVITRRLPIAAWKISIKISNTVKLANNPPKYTRRLSRALMNASPTPNGTTSRANSRTAHTRTIIFQSRLPCDTTYISYRSHLFHRSGYGTPARSRCPPHGRCAARDPAK